MPLSLLYSAVPSSIPLQTRQCLSRIDEQVTYLLTWQASALVRDVRRLCPTVNAVAANHRVYTTYYERILNSASPDGLVVSLNLRRISILFQWLDEFETERV